ncbi:DUF808 domain-containing protein [Enemella sp. A6]|uniref:DUF808 domain-containing protein n=1 Tax=Enemella sp. A6 TaxID=3440152 RepID=UPI003EBDB53D
MAGGLAALLDDVAVIAKMTSVAGSRAMGVVVDDAAVTPQYVQGFSPARELPMVWRIARGSLVNKAILLVLLLLLDHFLPIVLIPLLMVGGVYLSFEGAEKLWEKISGHEPAEAAHPVGQQGADVEKTMVRSAITTDFILSAEIMVISLNTINDTGQMALSMKAITLAVVAVLITLLVYGVVGLIVKLDDIGLHMMKRDSNGSQRLGKLLVDAMPVILAVLSGVGMVAMMWVGGHILIDGAHKLGWSLPHHLVHLAADPAAGVPGVGGFLSWLVATALSAVVGLLVGAVVVVIMHLLPIKKKAHQH